MLISSKACQNSDIPYLSVALVHTTFTGPGHSGSIPVSLTTLLKPLPLVAKITHGVVDNSFSDFKIPSNSLRDSAKRDMSVISIAHTNTSVGR